MEQCALAGAAITNDRYNLPSLDGQGEPAKHLRSRNRTGAKSFVQILRSQTRDCLILPFRQPDRFDPA